MVKKGVLREWGFGFRLGLCKSFLGWTFWVILDGFLRSEKKYFKDLKVLWKIVWFVSLYTLFRGTLFFPFLVKKVPQDAEFGFYYKAVLKSSITYFFWCSFFSPLVKRSVIISNKNVIYEFFHELSRDLILRILWN